MALPNLPSLSMPPINTNTIVVFVMVLVLLYGILLGHSKLKTFSLSIFVGMVMVLSFGDSLFTVLQKANWTLGGKINSTTVKTALFAIPVIALQFGKKESKRGGSNFVLTLALSLLTGALLVSTVFSFLDQGAIKDITAKSQIADWIYSFRLLWLAAVPSVVIVDSFFGRKPSH